MPWQITVFPDSAFRALEPECLAIKAAVIMNTSVDYFPKGGKAGTVEFYHRKQARVCRNTFSAELAAVDDGTSHALVVQGMVTEIMHGPLNAEILQNLMQHRNMPIPLVLTTDTKGFFSAVAAERISVPAEPHLLYLLRAQRDRLEIGSVSAVVGRYSRYDLGRAD